MLDKKYEVLVCADGFRMSVQGNSGAYCEPRNDAGPYTAVEVGYPSSADSNLLPYAENPDAPTDTIYGWVPSAVILEVINSHGGWVSGEMPPMEISDSQWME